jgi:restriction system protein
MYRPSVTPTSTSDAPTSRLAFVGALHGAQASRGIFITTSRFTSQALDYAERVNARLVLIDGPELAALMIEHDCGVIVEESFVLKRVDENFFEEP